MLYFLTRTKSKDQRSWKLTFFSFIKDSESLRTLQRKVVKGEILWEKKYKHLKCHLRLTKTWKYRFVLCAYEVLKETCMQNAAISFSLKTLSIQKGSQFDLKGIFFFVVNISLGSLAAMNVNNMVPHHYSETHLHRHGDRDWTWMFPFPLDQDELSWEKVSVEEQAVGEAPAAKNAPQQTCRAKTHGGRSTESVSQWNKSESRCAK